MSDLPLPGASPENLRSPEVLAGELVNRVERGLAELGVPSREHRGPGWCEFVPGIVGYCAEYDADQRGYSVDQRIYQVTEIHAAAAGLIGLENYRSRPVARDAFTHAFNVVEIEGQPFLVDLSFAQFFGQDGYLQQFENGKKSGIGNDNPLAQELINTGIVPLNDENLREYLRITTRNPEPDYIEGLRTDVLNAATPLGLNLEEEEIEELHSNLNNHNVEGGEAD